MSRKSRRPNAFALAVAVGGAAATGIGSTAEAKITRISVDCARSQSPTYCPGQSPTFEGRSFGAVGQYEKIRGTAYGELNPLDPRNAIITDIALAPRNARGNVEYSTDLFILKPLDLAKGNRRMFIDYNNRGAMRLGTINGGVVTNDPTKASDAGAGFIMNLGYSVVSMGWDPGANDPADPKLMKINAPVAKYPSGSSSVDITGPAYEYIVFDRAGVQSSGLTYPAATLDKSKATLTVRALLRDTPTPIDASGWEYASDMSIRLLPAGTAFKPGAIYEFVYTAKDPVVAGVGLAATRDLIAFLRYGNSPANPLAGQVRWAIGRGVSQSGNYLRSHIHLGLNAAEDGRIVFDEIGRAHV